MQHGGVAVPFGMAPPGAVTTDDARFCMPWVAPAAAHFENWGDSGIVVTSPLAETTSTDVDDDSGGNHQAQMVCSARIHCYFDLDLHNMPAIVSTLYDVIPPSLQGGAITQSADGHVNSLPVSKVESRDRHVDMSL